MHKCRSVQTFKRLTFPTSTYVYLIVNQYLMMLMLLIERFLRLYRGYISLNVNLYCFT